jgi:hypothetical protein
LKVIRGFIESVLRYGLPLDFLPVFIEPNMKKEKQLKTALAEIISRLRPELAKKAEVDAEEDEEDAENLPFVCQKFSGITRLIVKILIISTVIQYHNHMYIYVYIYVCI